MIRRIPIIAAAALLLAGCFKSVVTYTRYTLAVYNQPTETGEAVRARDIESYAYYVDTTEWRIDGYEDAVNGVITNKLTGEKRDTPDVLGAFNSSQEFSMSIVLTRPLSMIVVVNPELKLYAYRSYELPENLEAVYTKLYMASWRRTHIASGWVVVNRFYEEPEEPEEGGGSDEGGGDTSGGGDVAGGDDGGGETAGPVEDYGMGFGGGAAANTASAERENTNEL